MPKYLARWFSREMEDLLLTLIFMLKTTVNFTMCIQRNANKISLLRSYVCHPFITNSILDKMHTHSLQGFSGYIKTHILQSYQEHCSMVDCYVCTMQTWYFIIPSHPISDLSSYIWQPFIHCYVFQYPDSIFSMVRRGECEFSLYEYIMFSLFLFFLQNNLNPVKLCSIWLLFWPNLCEVN